MKFCNQDITTRSFKLGQLIYLVKIKKDILFFTSYCPFQMWALKTCNEDISKIIIASSFEHGQLIEDNE